MAVGTDPTICLSFLYKNDPFYSLCLSDLLTAPQRVKNKFLKEQKELTVALRKLEQQKQSRLRQLDEEKKQFHLLMIKKLSPRVTISRALSTATERNKHRGSSSVLVSSLASDKNSWTSLDMKSAARPGTGFFLATKGEFPTTCAPKFHKVSFQRILLVA